MSNKDCSYGNSLMFIIVNRGKGSKILDYASQLGIRGATAFQAHGTVSSQLFRFLEIDDVRKEIIMIAMPSSNEKEIMNKLNDKFHFNQPGKGIVFTLKLSSVYGSSHFEQNEPNTDDYKEKHNTPLQAVMTIVEKGNTDEILDFIEEQGFPRGTVIDAHGSADKSNQIINLMIEPEKDILLIITTREEAHRLANILTKYLNLESKNSGVLAILNIQHFIGITLTLRTSYDDSIPYSTEDKPGYSAIFAIVDNDKDQAVIQSAELAGSKGGTIIHARGSCSYHGKFLTRGVEPEREVVMIIAKDDKAPAICERIHSDLKMDQSGNGILLVLPLYDTVGIID